MTIGDFILKPGKTFNLNKQAKRFMATIVDPHARGEFKRAMIQAQLASEQLPPRREKGDRPHGNRGTTTETSYTQPDSLT